MHVAAAGVVDLAAAAVADVALVAETAAEVCLASTVLPLFDTQHAAILAHQSRMCSLSVCHKSCVAANVNLVVLMHLWSAAVGCHSVV